MFTGARTDDKNLHATSLKGRRLECVTSSTFTPTEAAELAVVIRSDFIESRHIGSAVVLDPHGSPVLGVGAPEVPVFTRSSLKPLQAIAAMSLGAELPGPAAALATASHKSEAGHVEVVSNMLTAAGLSVADLQCPSAHPADGAFRRELQDDARAAGARGHRSALAAVLQLLGQAHGVPRRRPRHRCRYGHLPAPRPSGAAESRRGRRRLRFGDAGRRRRRRLRGTRIRAQPHRRWPGPSAGRCAPATQCRRRRSRLGEGGGAGPPTNAKRAPSWARSSPTRGPSKATDDRTPRSSSVSESSPRAEPKA